MLYPKKHSKEDERLEALDSYAILDTLPEKDYDELTAIAAEICGTPISLISLVDQQRQWFKSNHGLGARHTPREFAFCAHAINNELEPLIVHDARVDNRFHDNPLVTGEPHVIFYAGMPLMTQDGYPLGTLCVIDHKPKELTPSQVKSLQALTNQVMKLLELRRNKIAMENMVAELQEKNAELDRFAYVAAHDLKSPLINISSMAKIFKSGYEDKVDDQGRKILELLTGSAANLNEMIDGLLRHTRSGEVLNEEKSPITPQECEHELNQMFSAESNLELSVECHDKHGIVTNKPALSQILLNLVANSIKYNDKDKTKVSISVIEKGCNYVFTVEDNGPGISAKDAKKAFELFQVLTPQDRNGNKGTGIGLSTVKKLVTKMGGEISIDTSYTDGCRIVFSILK